MEMNRKFRLYFNLLILGSCLTASVSAQQVFRCVENGHTTYSQFPCPKGKIDVIDVSPNTIDRSEARSLYARKLQRELEEENDRVIRAQARQHELSAELEREEMFKRATTVHPGAHGLTRGQRELAAKLARTQEERDLLMREATTPIPGSKGGLTASQLDTAYRMNAVNKGEPLPPSTLPPPVDPKPVIPEPVIPEPPSLIVNCDPAGCFDTSGRRLEDTGGGTFHRNDGKACIQAGPNVICN